jgi:hypothetical protein
MRSMKDNSSSIRGHGIAITILCLSIAAFAVAGCDVPLLGKSNDATSANYTKTSSGGSSGTALQAFQGGFYAFATVNCAQCHGSSQSPLFAVSDVNSAYTAASTVVDFSDPAGSELAVYAGNGHCGVTNCNGQTQTVVPLLQAWATAEANAAASSSTTPTGSGGTTSGAGAGLAAPSGAIAYFTSSVTMPAKIPGAGTTFAIMRWPLSSMIPSNNLTNGGYFELQIQLLTPTTYRITSPKLAVLNPTAVTGIHVMIKTAGTSGNGQEDPLAMDWASLQTNQVATTIPNPLPTTSLNVTALTTDAMELPVLSTSDALVIGFEALTSGNATSGCQNLSGTNGFVSNVLPQMQQICFNCHLSGGAGYSEFPMVSNNNTQLCATTLLHVDLANPASSDIVMRPQGFDGHANFTGTFNATPFIDWIQTE